MFIIIYTAIKHRTIGIHRKVQISETIYNSDAPETRDKIKDARNREEKDIVKLKLIKSGIKKQ